MNLDQEMDKLAQLVALRAHRKMGRKPKLNLVGNVKQAEPDIPEEDQAIAALPDETQFQAIDISPRAIKMRAIVKIANANSWHSAIVHFLESRNAQYLSDLTDPQLDDLKDRMDGYVDAASMGCSLADCLPAS